MLHTDVEGIGRLTAHGTTSGRINDGLMGSGEGQQNTDSSVKLFLPTLTEPRKTICYFPLYRFGWLIGTRDPCNGLL